MEQIRDVDQTDNYLARLWLLRILVRPTHQFVVGKIFLLLTLPSVALAQKINLNGYISDFSTGEVLIGATITYPEKNQNTISNKYGYYTLLMPLGNSQVRVSSVGYKGYVQ